MSVQTERVNKRMTANMSEGPLCCLWALEIPACTSGDFICVCACWGGEGMKGWHLTHKNVSAQVMAGANDQVFIFILLLLSGTHSQADTHPNQHLPLEHKEGGDDSGKGFRRGDCFNSV